MTLTQILNDAVAVLNKNNIDNAKFDAEQILLYLLDIDMTNFLLIKDEDLEKNHNKNFISDLIMKYDKLISYRYDHFPLQYILGETFFCGLKFKVDENVLIPRFDTEVLVEKVLEDNQDNNKTILDLCTGSGCIAISLSAIGHFKTIVATDISLDSLNVASENAENIIENLEEDIEEQKQHIYFLQSDMFDNLYKIEENIGINKFDIITCNPPYIKTEDIQKLDEEVKRFEPHIALDGDKDGLKFYKLIAKNAKKYLNPNGKIYLEIGYDQGEKVKKIFEKEKYKDVDIVKDLSKHDRVVVVKI